MNRDEIMLYALLSLLPCNYCMHAEKAELKKELEEEYKAQLEDNAREMEEMKLAFEEKLRTAHAAGDSVSHPLKVHIYTWQGKVFK